MTRERRYGLAMARMAKPEDIDAICGALPQVEFGFSWGDRPTYKVPQGPKGRGFVLYRAPHQTAIDPDTGQPYADLLVIVVADAHVKAALVEDPSVPFFTIPHFDGYNAVLVQESRLGEMDRDHLEEILLEAWAARAPKRLVREFFAAR
ncbi:MmcQ/YjbR family DNA-binding protein [Arthrobacter sp. 2MCAF14]